MELKTDVSPILIGLSQGRYPLAFKVGGIVDERKEFRNNIGRDIWEWEERRQVT